MSLDRKSLIRQAIEQAVPAETYFAELEQRKQKSVADTGNASIYQEHLNALTKEHDALLGDEFLNENEASSIRALVAYVAYTHDISEQAVCAMVEEHFHVDEIRRLPRSVWETAVGYLVDLKPEELIN